MAYAPQTPYIIGPNLPHDVYQAATTAQLGASVRAEYRPTLTGRRILGGVICLVVGLAFFFAGVATLNQPGNASSGIGSSLLLVVVGLLLVGFSIYTFSFGLIYKHWGVYVYDYGFVHKKGSQAGQPFRWDQIEAVWYQVIHRYRNGIHTGTTHRYRVRRIDGYEIVLNDRFTNVATLGETVSNQVTHTKMPQVIAAYNAGQVIAFGPLSVSRQGIQNARGSLLPWPEITDVSLQNGYVAVSRAGKWLRWSSQPVRDIPNIFLFIALVRFILKK